MGNPNELTIEEAENYGKQPPTGVPIRANNSNSGLGSVSTISPQELTEEQAASYGMPQTPTKNREMSIEEATQYGRPQPSPGPAPQPRELSFEEAANYGGAPTPTPEAPPKPRGTESQTIAAFQESPVGKTLAALSVPLRAETAGILAAGDLLGIPGFKELKQMHNPEGSLIPNAYISDISDFYIDKAAQAAGIPTTPGVAGSILRGMTATTKFGIGLGANIFSDPLTGIRFGQLTRDAEEIQKMGGALKNAKAVAKGAEPIIDLEALRSPEANQKNLLGYRVPFTDVGFDVRAQALQNVFKRAVDLPPVRALGKAIQVLSPDTGEPVLDRAGKLHDARKMGDPVDISNRYVIPKNALNMTADEDRLASALVEATPNLAPPLPEKLLSAAQKRRGGILNPEFWGEYSSIRERMAAVLQNLSKKLGVELAPGRDIPTIEAAMMAKRAGVENIMDKFNAGVLTEENIADKVLENHLPHVMNPSYKGVKNLKEYEAKLAADEQEVSKTLGGTFLSGRDPTRQRMIRTTLEEANAKMLDAKGLDQYFVTDPVKAAVARLIESKRLLRDSEYLDTVKNFGQKVTSQEARKAGLVSIDHPELSGKVIAVPNSADSAEMGRIVRHKDLYYAPEIASKVQYRVAPPPLTGLWAALRDYNRVFRSAIFMSSPGIRVGNVADNVLKVAAVTGKDFMQATKDTYKVLLDKSPGFRSAPTALRPNGVFYDGTALKNLLDKFGITRTGTWSEGMGAFVEAGKKLTLNDVVERPAVLTHKYAWERAQALVKTVDTLGEHGENASRATLFLQRLRAGWEPEQAANEVTKWLFNYNSNSPAMDFTRLFMPFMQHPFKTLSIAPKLLGTAPGAYNFIQNSFPHVVANAFHDPITQQELNTILPDSIKQRDGIYGSFIPANTWLSAIFAKPDSKLGSMGWFDPRIGLRILNHFNYFSKGGSDRLVGETSPVIQGLVGMALGREDFGKSLDFKNGNVNISNRLNYFVDKLVAGVFPFPNLEKIVMQHFGLVEPKYMEPDTVLVLKGMAGQFGGITDLDRDVNSKLLSTRHAFEDQKKQLFTAIRKEMSGNMNTGSLQRYLKNQYGNITAMSSIDLYKQMTMSSDELQKAELGAQALGGGMSAGDFAARMKGLSEAMRQLNLAYQLAATRKLQMSNESK